MTNFTKDYFQNVWGENGYYEHFSYGVGINRVIETCIMPFISEDINILEIGPGGGTFTQFLINGCRHLTAIDVIRKPVAFNDLPNFTYHELPNNSFDCVPVKSGTMDFVFSYNVFCHLSNEAIQEYLKGIRRVLKVGGSAVFMLSNFEHTKKHTNNPEKYSVGDLLPMGHYYQDDRTIDLVIGSGWNIESRNMIPEHRDIIIHIKKVKNAQPKRRGKNNT